MNSNSNNIPAWDSKEWIDSVYNWWGIEELDDHMAFPPPPPPPQEESESEESGDENDSTDSNDGDSQESEESSDQPGQPGKSGKSGKPSKSKEPSDESSDGSGEGSSEKSEEKDGESGEPSDGSDKEDGEPSEEPSEEPDETKPGKKGNGKKPSDETGEGDGQPSNPSKDIDKTRQTSSTSNTPTELKSEGESQENVDQDLEDYNKILEEEDEPFSYDENEPSLDSMLAQNPSQNRFWDEKVVHINKLMNPKVRMFVDKLMLMAESTKEIPGPIDSKKAFIALLKAPHTLLEQKKMKRADPEIIFVIDSHSTYYSEEPKFLTEFAATCHALGHVVWRARKLSQEFYLHQNPTKITEYKTLLDWAKAAKLVSGQTIVFIGDGCSGGSRDAYGFFNIKELTKFREKYNPIFIHKFEKGENCGCPTAIHILKAGWRMISNIKTFKQLEVNPAKIIYSAKK